MVMADWFGGYFFFPFSHYYPIVPHSLSPFIFANLAQKGGDGHTCSLSPLLCHAAHLYPRYHRVPSFCLTLSFVWSFSRVSSFFACMHTYTHINMATLVTIIPTYLP